MFAWSCVAVSPIRGAMDKGVQFARCGCCATFRWTFARTWGILQQCTLALAGHYHRSFAVHIHDDGHRGGVLGGRWNPQRSLHVQTAVAANRAVTYHIHVSVARSVVTNVMHVRLEDNIAVRVYPQLYRLLRYSVPFSAGRGGGSIFHDDTIINTKT